MAFASAARFSALGRATHNHHQQRVVRVHKPCLASAAAAASPDMSGPAAALSSKYAILRLGGVRQMLQEGLLYTCPKHCLLQEQQQQPQHDFSTAAGNGAPHATANHLQDSHASTAADQAQRSFVLGGVLGLHNGQQFTWGTPFVPNTLVEVEVVEEFQGPKPLSSAAAALPLQDSTMTIYRVKHIRAAAAE